MAGGSVSSTYIAAASGCSVVLLIIALAFLTIRRLKSLNSKKPHEGIRIINSSGPTWYDPSLKREVLEQVGPSDVHVEEGLLAVFTAEKRTKSAECLTEARNDYSTSNLQRSKQFSASTQSLGSLLGDESLFQDDTSRRHSFTIRSSPYVEFNLLWATSNSSLSVYVVRITSLPPSYSNATCTYRVTLHKPDKTTISKSSNKVKKVNLNPDCLQVFSFKVPLDEVQKSELVLEVCARKNHHLRSKPIGQIRYELPDNLLADKPLTTSQPLRGNKKVCTSTSSSPRGSMVLQSNNQWGDIQVLTQYQVTGGWQGRIKVMVIRAQNALIGKRGGSYKIEMIVKKGEETETVQMTKQVQGPSPVWKTPFIFDVTQSKIHEYRIELTLIRVNRMKKTTTMGRAILGLNTTPSGTQHWQDMISSPNKEITVWHTLSYLEE